MNIHRTIHHFLKSIPHLDMLGYSMEIHAAHEVEIAVREPMVSIHSSMKSQLAQYSTVIEAINFSSSSGYAAIATRP